MTSSSIELEQYPADRPYGRVSRVPPGVVSKRTGDANCLGKGLPGGSLDHRNEVGIGRTVVVVTLTKAG